MDGGAWAETSVGFSSTTCRHRTTNYLRPLDEIICLSKRQINTKPNYPRKGSALFASCARPPLFFGATFPFSLFLSPLYILFHYYILLFTFYTQLIRLGACSSLINLVLLTSFGLRPPLYKHTV